MFRCGPEDLFNRPEEEGPETGAYVQTAGDEDESNNNEGVLQYDHTFMPGHPFRDLEVDEEGVPILSCTPSIAGGASRAASRCR